MSALSIETQIAIDYLSQFKRTKSINRYSPRASTIARKASRCYPKLYVGGHFIIQIGHITEAAKIIGLKINFTSDDAKLNISAEEFNCNKLNAVYSNQFICRHNIAPYSIEILPLGQIRRAPCCELCINGFEPPSPTDIKLALNYLIKPSGSTPGAGALAAAAKMQGFIVYRSHDASLMIQRPMSTKSKSKTRKNKAA